MLDRGLQPLVELMGSLLGARIPPADMIDLPARMTDLLARHPNIAALLRQSMHSVADAGALIAREWLDHLLDHGRRVNEASDLEGDDTALMLRQIALFVTVRPDALVEVWLCAQDVLKAAHKDALEDSHDAGNGVDGGGPPPGLVG